MRFKNTLPRFNTIDLPNFIEHLQVLLAQNKAEIDRILTQSLYTWENLMTPLDDIADRLHQFFAPLAHLNAVRNHEKIRTCYTACLPILTAYESALGQNKALYEAVSSLKRQEIHSTLTDPQKKVLEDLLLDFTLSGVALNTQEKQRFTEIEQSSSDLANQFENNLLDATDGWTKHIVDVEQLKGIPEHAIVQAAKLASDQAKTGWILTLEQPCYIAVSSYAENSALREEMYYAYITRASELWPEKKQWDNTPLIEEILKLKHEQAHLLGYRNYAELSLAKKMAKTTEEVLSFLYDLADQTLPQAKEEFAELQAFGREEMGLSPLEPWDLAFVSEKKRQKQYAISQEELRPYFPQPKVLAGMFEVVHKLYGLTVQKMEGIEVWDPNVLFYNVYDDEAILRGQIYCDLYARPQKRGGAWMDDCISRRRLVNGDLQIPVAYLICNFVSPTGELPALFSHEEVTTLFHEFGHCLHHVLTKVDEPSVSGTRGVEWDAVELPSQFFENWCWEKEALHLFSGHYQTDAPLPEALFDKLWKARNFQSGLQMMRQLELSLFDFRIHAEYDPTQGGRVQEILDAIRKSYCVTPVSAYNRFAQSFSHIFAGAYAAGYYSYKWAEVLSSDAFSKFEERGIFDLKTGKEFLHMILEKGGSRPAIESFIAFRGRAPRIESLLRHTGIGTHTEEGR